MTIKKTTLKNCLFFALLGVLSGALHAAPGDLDPSFDGDGKVTTRIGSSYMDAAGAVIQQADGKLVVAGASYPLSNDADFAILRYNADGTLDTSFDFDGVATTAIGLSYDTGASVIQQEDGKLVVAGTSYKSVNDTQFALVRYNSNGARDTGFGSAGKVTTDFDTSYDGANAIIQQADGKLVVSGYARNVAANAYSMVLVRYNANGSLDTTFDTDGKAIHTNGAIAFAMIQQPDGKLVIAGGLRESRGVIGNSFVLVRFNTNGSLDTTFGTGGTVTTAIGASETTAYSLVQQADGKLVAGGYSTTPTSSRNATLVRYNTDGSLDTGFGTGGTTVGSFGREIYSIVKETDGKLVVVGNWQSRPWIARFSANGIRDTSFVAAAPFSTGDALSVIRQVDGKLVMAGNSNSGNSNSGIVLARFLSGQSDTDADGVDDAADNCPVISNADQINTDGDSEGNACDSDDDNDSVEDTIDAFPLDATESVDTDGDGIGNNTDTTPNGDTDNDGVDNSADNCVVVSNTSQTDTDNDGAGDACDATPSGDTDGDNVDNATDNCVSVSNADQFNTDGDSEGDVCDNDDDNDGVADASDAFPLDASESVDADGDGIGNNADTTPNGDTDSDGVDNAADNCVAVSNASQTDTDNDGMGDACDSTLNGDNDNDGIDNLADNCVAVSNTDQLNTDGDSQGDACDTTPNGDTDGDGVDNLSDNCPTVSNADQVDIDADGAGDVCDLFPLDDALLLEQNGAAKNENFASSVAMADMNDDGVVDVLVGAPMANVSADGKTLKKAGVIRIISGADNSTLRTLNGTVANQQFGTAIAVVDDQNSDSVPDVLVGEPLADITATVLSKTKNLKDAGLVAVYSGSDGALLDVIAEGNKAGDNFGAAVAVGDLNNDVTADLVVGAPMSDAVAKNAGQVTVFDGLGKTVLYARYGYQPGEHFGAAVAVGAGVLFIGSPQFDVDQGDGTSLKDAGHVSGYFGYEEGISGEVFAYYGGEQGDALGAAVAAAPNGDHAIGMPLADATGKDSGSVMLYRMVSPNVMQGTVLSGATAGDNFGGALAIQDVDNDGVLDFAIGAAKFDVNTSVEKRKAAGVKTVLLKDAGRLEVLSGAAL